MEDIITFVTIILIPIILIPIILIFFGKFILKLYSTKDPRLTENEIKILKEDIAKREFTLYILNIVLSLIVIFVLQRKIQGFVIIPIFIIGFSIIFRVLKRVKISNLFCGVIVIPTIIFIIIYTFYFSIEEISFLQSDYNSHSHSNSNNYFNDVYYFNSKFAKYEGDRVTGAQVKALVNEVISSNSSEENSNWQVTIIGPNGFKVEGNQVYNIDVIKNNERYKVEITAFTEEEDNSEHTVKEITITKSM